ncbi:ASCH domain-containing protein [Bacillus sp. FJAT-49736]|uniref:ASCH domain-containing protein n=1 Tax=Bacillus sp. FJAT-49736 TaxID=2833582 RepID=UPI001BC8F1BD|nr:ASCH domain-containing protein [Bacillus sp. FJAT-49736]MBS4174362.1 ASCH domain-containing protein [Bacillus sp. FJAT-49736]
MNMSENSSLPPKTCSVDRLVTLEKDVQKVIAGEKTATRRNGRYADIGEIMVLEGKKFVIENVYNQQLGDMTEEHARQEGFANMEEYKESILAIHPGMRWVPKMKIWVHEFKAI